MLLKKERILHWTFHVRGKMRQHGLSEARVRRIMHSPNRVEKGIAEKTIAFMQTVKGPKNSYELWAMAQDIGSKRKMISAWRYPGITKPGEPVILGLLEREYKEYSSKRTEHADAVREKLKKSKWFRRVKPAKAPANLLILKSRKKD